MKYADLKIDGLNENYCAIEIIERDFDLIYGKVILISDEIISDSELPINSGCMITVPVDKTVRFELDVLYIVDYKYAFVDIGDIITVGYHGEDNN